jgi:hypothetical protein
MVHVSEHGSSAKWTIRPRMASAGSRVFVLGGESFSATRQDDPALVHVLDTSASFPAILFAPPLADKASYRFGLKTEHIRYPDTSRPPGSSGAQMQKPKGLPGQRAMSPVAMGSGDERAMSPNEWVANAPHQWCADATICCSCGATRTRRARTGTRQRDGKARPCTTTARS